MDYNYSFRWCGKFFLVVSVSFTLTQLLSSCDVFLACSLFCGFHLALYRSSRLPCMFSFGKENGLKKGAVVKLFMKSKIKHTGTNYTDMHIKTSERWNGYLI